MRINDASAGRLAFTHREPIGPAIASGCPVIVKPAKKTPLSAFMLVDILREAGLPESWGLPLLTDSLETTEALTGCQSRVFQFYR